MGNMILGIGDLGYLKEQNNSIKTYALGSCVAVILYDTVMRGGAMAHIALPNSRTDREKAVLKPGYFADTAIPRLLYLMKKNNPGLNPRKLIVKMAGGASVMDKNNFFNIGEKNINASRSALLEHGLSIMKEDVGSTISRTVTLDISSGMVLLFNPAKGIWQI